MLQSRLIKYIRELSAKDKERFSHFVHSPYFNQHEKTTQLLEWILEYMDDSDGHLERPAVFRQLFPEEPYDEQKLHNILSNLKKLFHRFLAHKHFEKLDFQEQLFTVEAAFDNNQFDLFTNRAKQLEKSLNTHPYHDSQYYLVNYRLNDLLTFYTGELVDRSKADFFQKMLDDLDRFYIIEKLKKCCHLTANMMLINTRYNFRFLDEILHQVESNWDFYHDDTSIILYYTILKSLNDEEDPAHYDLLKKMLALQLDSFSPEEQRDLYSFSYNYCIRQINQGKSEFQRELFNLYKEGLKNGLLLNNGYLSEWNYKNVVTLGCSLKEFEWTENFIQEYKNKLPLHRRENSYNYNLANLYYNKKMYDQAKEILQTVQYTDIKYHINSVFLLLRTYYALRETDAILSLIETFRVYIIRTRKMTTDQKRGYTNFLRFARKLVELKHYENTYSQKSLKEKLKALADKIENTSNVINKHWLLEEVRA